MSPVFPALRFRPLFLSLVCSAAFVALTGCGMGTTATPNAVSGSMRGKVHGGQQPVSGALIQVYAAGSGGNGSAATPLLATPTMTDANGSFSLPDYTCPSATSQIYIVATGGNPGLGSGGDNPALAMMAALGNCGDIGADQFIFIDEVTTVAAAWTLAPFTSSYENIGASATNSLGLANAFLNANLIVNTANGLTATLPSNLTTEPGKIYALADAIASCINSDGGSGCTPLFTAATPSGGTAPTNTFDAAINIVKNPGNNVAGVFAAVGPQPPFATSLTQAPNDWTLSLTVKGGGLLRPTALGVDSQGNVWAADYYGLLSAFNPQGTALSSGGFGSGALSEDYALTIDSNDDVWVSVEEQPHHGTTAGSVVKFQGVSSGGTLGASTVFSNVSINYPYGLATDGSGNILIANNSVAPDGSATSVAVLNPTTNTYTQLQGNGLIEGATAIAPDTFGGVWVTDGVVYSVSHIDSSGNVLETDCCGGTNGLALDSQGNLWVANYSASDPDGDTHNGSISEMALQGIAPNQTIAVAQGFITGGGIMNPSDVQLDAAQNLWITNYHSPAGQTYQTFSELAGSNSANPGTALSPSTGYGLDANLIQPYASAIDASGNLWVSNYSGDDLVMFFGMAAPTKTPKPIVPTAP